MLFTEYMVLSCFFWREISDYLILLLNLIAVETEVQREAYGSVLESDRFSPCGFFLLCFVVFDVFLNAFCFL